MPLSPAPLRLQSDDLDAEREDYIELLESAGWRRFCQYVTREYKGDGYFNRMSSALKAGGTAPEVLHATSLVLSGLLDYPLNRVETLRRKS